MPYSNDKSALERTSADNEGIAFRIATASIKEACGDWDFPDAKNSEAHARLESESIASRRSLSPNQISSLRASYLEVEKFPSFTRALSNQGRRSGIILDFDHIAEDILLLSLVVKYTSLVKAERFNNELHKHTVKLVLLAQSGPTIGATIVDETYIIYMDCSILDRCINIALELFYSHPYTSRFDPDRQPYYTAAEGTRRWLDQSFNSWDIPDSCRVIEKESAELFPMAVSATAFLLCHEVAHILNGHLASRIDCLALANSVEDRALILRTMEYDADASAVVNFFVAYMDPLQRSDPLHLSAGTRRLIMAMAVGLKAMEGAAASQSLESLDFNPSGWHLPIGRRIIDCMNVMSLVVQRHLGPSYSAEIDNAIKNDFLCIEHLAVGVFHRGSSALSTEFGFYNPGDSHQDLAATWQKIRPILLKSKIGSHKLAP